MNGEKRGDFFSTDVDDGLLRELLSNSNKVVAGSRLKCGSLARVIQIAKNVFIIASVSNPQGTA